VYELLMGKAPVLEKFAFACAHGDELAARAMLGEQPGLMAELVRKYPKLLADAAWANQLDGVRVLLDAGFPVEETGGGEGTALDRASIRGYVELVKLLLSRGASVTVKNAYGGDPVRACAWGSLNFRDRLGDYPATAEALIAAGAPVPETAGGSEAVAEVMRRHGAKA
jgi:ankyrin repeat protein